MVCHVAIFVAAVAKNYSMIGGRCSEFDDPEELVFALKFSLFLGVYLKIEHYTILVRHLF